MSEPTPTCDFEHPGIMALGVTEYRLTKGDSVAALVMCLDNSDVVVPLHAVAKLFNLAPESPDGRMVELIEKGLQFVKKLHPGDPLPTEVLTGAASWEPTAYHLQVATARLHLQLVNWISGSSAGQDGQLTQQLLLASMEDPSNRPRVQVALRRAAAELGVEGGGPAVAKLIEELAVELSFIEALRERLLDRGRMMIKRLGRMTGDTQMAAAKRETIIQVLRLSMAGVAQITSRFEVVDGLTCEILPTLRNLEKQSGFLRPHRDWLYCTLLGWDPVLLMWDDVGGSVLGDGAWRGVEAAYRFLAARYMAVQEWQSALNAEKEKKEKPAFVW